MKQELAAAHALLRLLRERPKLLEGPGGRPTEEGWELIQKAAELATDAVVAGQCGEERPDELTAGLAFVTSELLTHIVEHPAEGWSDPAHAVRALAALLDAELLRDGADGAGEVAA